VREFNPKYKEIEMVHEIVSPDAFLWPFIIVNKLFRLNQSFYSKTSVAKSSKASLLRVASRFLDENFTFSPQFSFAQLEVSAYIPPTR